MLTDHPEVIDYLDVIGHQRYGPLVAVPRLLRMLDRRKLRTTFFIPGWVAEAWPAVARSIRDAGHEIGHHGYMHESVRGKDEATEEGYLRRGLEALDTVLGVRPIGYRPPSCDMNFRTPDLLARHGFTYDSGMMDSDHPYKWASGLIELPMHWSLDDWNRYNYVPGYASSPILRPSEVCRRLGGGARCDRRGRWPVRPDDAPVHQRSTGPCRGAREVDRAGAVDGRRLGRRRRRGRRLGRRPGPARRRARATGRRVRAGRPSRPRTPTVMLFSAANSTSRGDAHGPHHGCKLATGRWSAC